MENICLPRAEHVFDVNIALSMVSCSRKARVPASRMGTLKRLQIIVTNHASNFRHLATFTRTLLLSIRCAVMELRFCLPI